MLQLGGDVHYQLRWWKSPAPRFFQHPSSVSALRADPPSPTRGEGRVSASPPHAARTSAPPRSCPRRSCRARRPPCARWSCRRAAGRTGWPGRI
ncbi:MAG: hypothetical protein EOQ47_18775 [Mesorhizobium sp.]|nr:MAG: hypothetical protein EOQ47_18775 [Mesorhizobium sp.]